VNTATVHALFAFGSNVVAITSAGPAYSTDGTAWTNSTGSFGVDSGPASVVIDGSTAVVYAGTTSSNTVHRNVSTNGGQSWTTSVLSTQMPRAATKFGDLFYAIVNNWPCSSSDLSTWTPLSIPSQAATLTATIGWIHEVEGSLLCSIGISSSTATGLGRFLVIASPASRHLVGSYSHVSASSCPGYIRVR
jgi:hypothetical protein